MCSASFDPHLLHLSEAPPLCYCPVIYGIMLSQTTDFVRSANNLVRVICSLLHFTYYLSLDRIGAFPFLS